MASRRSNRLSEQEIQSLGENISSISLDNVSSTAPKSKRKTKATIVRDFPGAEYVSNVQIEDCESDEQGSKGVVFANYVYNKLKHVDPTQISAASASRPKVYIMVGPPGAGKSTIKRNFNITNYVNIDLDEIKKLLQKCFPNDKSIYGFGIIHHLRRLAKHLLNQAIEDNINILFDTTGRMKDLMTEVINSTNAAEYEQYIIIISTSLENCLQRAEMRNRSETDREPMTSEMVSGSYESFMDPSKDKGTISFYLLANPDLFSNAKELYVFDNNGASPRLVFKKVNTEVETAENYPNFYNMSIVDSPPYFIIKKRGGNKTRRTRKIIKTGKTRKNKINKKRNTRRYL